MIPPAYTLLIGDYRSMVDRITQEFMDATDRYRSNDPWGYELSEKTSWYCCRMEMRDRFMTYGWMNYLYHKNEITAFMKRVCPGCICITDPEHAAFGHCDQTEMDVERCYQQEEDRKSVASYARFWESE